MVNVGANPAQASAFSDEQIAQLRSLISAAVHSERVGSQQPPIPAASSLLSPASPQRQPPSTAIQTRPPHGPSDLNNASTGAEQLQHGVAQFPALGPSPLSANLLGTPGTSALAHNLPPLPQKIQQRIIKHAPLPPTRPSGRLGSDASSPLSQDPLDGRLAFLQSQAIAPSTRRAYQAGIRRYSTFCYSRQWDPFPASELQLRYFASWLSDQVSFPTIKLYLAGIRYAHIENRLTDPFADAPLLHLLLRGIKRTNGLSSRRRLPITMSVMRQLKGALSADPQFASQDKLMLWSAFTLAFFGFLRSSEFTSPSSTYFNSLVHLSHSDISFTSDGSLTMQLKSSKTDPFRKGCSIKLAPSGRSVCAVRAMHRYLAHQPSRSATPLYLFSTGQFLTRDKVTSILRILLQRLGFATERYASHSFRIGAATTAAEAGLPSWLIQTLGRWSSNCYTQYIRTPASILQSVPAQLATTHSSPLHSWDPSTGQCRPL
ncbi:uncharacterized protein LOC144639048 [Oculina patagonica]